MREAITLDVPTTTIGIDLGDRRSHGCAIDAEASVKERFTFATDRKGLERAFRDRSPCRVVLEVGTHSPWVSRWLTARGHEVLVANPKEVKSIGHSDRKHDRADAEQLARLGRADPQLLRPIEHRGEEAQRQRAMLAVRRKLVGTRTSLIVQARGLAKGLGERLPGATSDGFVRAVHRSGLEGCFPGFAVLLRMIDQLCREIRSLDQEIEKISRQSYKPATAALRQVPGVGPLTALTYVLTIEDPTRFEKSRRVGAYVGLRPRQRESGDQRPVLSITKAGDRELRMLLVEAAQWILARGPDSDLRRFGKALIRRGGTRAKRKAIVAVARKLAVLLHRLWVSGEPYEPLYNARHQEVAMA